MTRPRHLHPAQLIVLGFAGAVAAGTALLSLPAATVEHDRAPLLVALFTATSAVCVTGLTVVDTATYWSALGRAIILAGVQVGGLGILTLASLLVLSVSRRLNLRGALAAMAETRAVGVGEVRRVLLGVFALTLLVEAVTTLVLALRFATTYDEPPPRAVYLGLFHAVSAFNNAGFALWPDNLVRFVTDPVVSLAAAGATIVGGLGFPVLIEVVREWRVARTWSLHTRLTLSVSALLVVAGFLVVLAFEWTNPLTLQTLHGPGKLVAAFFTGVQPRTSGFNSLDVSAFREQTLLASDVLMFIGAGSAGTGGGVKVTTIAVLALAVWAEVRGDPDVQAFGRRIPYAAVRQALAVTVIALTAVLVATLVLVAVAPYGLARLLFEALSAFGTVGLSTGITAQLPVAGQLVLVTLMFLGRVGPITLGIALALREHGQLYRLPEERPIVG
ncbi:MAG TPA: potassium transporter TrkG [Mycobacteriales bacterium]|nr:potassium transporter TrkG [Mycobacteriales bacterium]